MPFSNCLMKAVNSLTPFNTLTWLTGRIANAQGGPFTQFLIRSFIKVFDIDMTDVAQQDLSAYKTFNEFFIRKLRPESRPISQECTAIVPVDGTVGACGQLRAGRLIQAKGVDYSFKALMGGNIADCAPFEMGQFATLYLSPANYHRVHMPIDGTLVKTIHIPGKHFPVGRRNTSKLHNLYTLNERLVCLFGTREGPFCLIFVGAALVGSIHTSWGGTVVRRRGIEVKYYDPDQFTYKKGDEIGWFEYGSTVICLWPDNTGALTDKIIQGSPVKYGEPMTI